MGTGLTYKHILLGVSTQKQIILEQTKHPMNLKRQLHKRNIRCFFRKGVNNIRKNKKNKKMTKNYKSALLKRLHLYLHYLQVLIQVSDEIKVLP